MEKIENRLYELFDYQRFERNEKLKSFIDDASQRYEASPELNDAALSFATGGRKAEEPEKKDPTDEE